MKIDPHAKAAIDALMDAEARQRSRHGWIAWLAVLVLSLGSLYLFNHDIVSGWLGVTLAVAGAIGVILFLGFLSTKAFGRSNTSYDPKWWWLRR